MAASGSVGLAFWMGGILVALGLVTGGAWYASRAVLTQDMAAVSDEAEPAPKPENADEPPPSPDMPDAAPASEKNADPEAAAPTEPKRIAEDGADDARETVETGSGGTSESKEETATDDRPPRLHEVRLESDGLAVIAGQVMPFSDFVLRLDGSEIARASADGSGAFATVATLEPSRAARILTLAQVDAEGGEIASPDELVLAPVRLSEPERTVEQTDVAASDPSGTEAFSEPDTDSTRTEGTVEIAALPASTETPDKERAAEPAETDQSGSTDASPDSAPVSTAAATEAEARTKPEPSAQETAREQGPLPVSEPELATAARTSPADEAASTAAGTVATAPVTGEPAVPQKAAAESKAALAPNPRPATAAKAPLQPAHAAEVTFAAPAQVSQTGAVAGPTQAPAAPTAPSPEDTQQVAILRLNEDGVRVLRPADPRVEVMSQVALDSISYSERGDVQLQGRAQEQAQEVRVYLDNRPIAALDVDASGSWRGALPQVDTGVYTLRIDEVDAEGRVTSRVETPFKREAPEVLAAATARNDSRIAAVTVQKGDTLWAISRERYGEGILYVRVFEANRGSIRDPDLIYPGQVFKLPGE